MRATIAATLTLLTASGVFGVAAQEAGDGGRESHGLSMFGDLKYPAGFEHFDYVNPDAPKGGSLRLAAIGTFDSLNPYILRGVAAAGSNLMFETLTRQSLDEPFSEYGLLAESVEMPEDRSWVAFTLRPEARWHDGTPVTVDDVIYSFQALTSEGHPFFRAYYANIASAEGVGERKVRFTFEGELNRELPLIVGQMPIIQKAYYADRPFAETSLEPPVGSGPYRIQSVDAGRSITYRRDPDYWGRDLPINRGHDNIDVIRFDYYRDATVAIEALKAREYDFRQENIAKEWATAYDIRAVRQGLLVKETIDHDLPTGMQGFVLNTRRDKFSDPRVRRALAHAFDFEWANQNLFHGQYTRTESYFSNSELASVGLPEGRELEILEPYRGRVPDEVFTTEYRAPVTDGTGNIRDNLRTAVDLLAEAGWEVRDGVLVHAESDRRMEIEFLLSSPAFERIVSPYLRNLERLGIRGNIRTVDTSQYQNRTDDFDFDIVVNSWGQSLSPGNEQRNFWSSEAADMPGTSNYAGVRDPVVDELITRLIHADSREELVATTRALDRVLLWGHYVVPHWHIRSFRLVYWDKFARPADMPPYGLGFPAIWWVDPDKDATVERVADTVAEPAPDEAGSETGTQPGATPEAEADSEAGPGDAVADEGPDYLWIVAAVIAVLVAGAVIARRRGRKS